MHKVAVMIAENLHFDMMCATDKLLHIEGIVSEGCLCLAAAGEDVFLQLARIGNDAHASASAAPACLQHYRVADALGDGSDLADVFRKFFACRQHRNSGYLRQGSRRNFVA